MPRRNDPIDRNEIALFAYYAWEKDGGPEGRDVDYWLEAEAQLKATRSLLFKEIQMQLHHSPAKTVASARSVPVPRTGFRPRPLRQHPARESTVVPGVMARA